MTQLDIFATRAALDALKQVDEEGVDRWSARDMQPVVGYDRWENFAEAISRAKLACTNSGYDSTSQFRESTKITTNARGQRRSAPDLLLTEFAAYLTLMNGDPKKQAIAGAQSYFAIRTKEAETRQQLDELEVARRYVKALEEKRELAAINARQAKEIEAAAPKVRAYEKVVNSDGLIDMTSLADALGINVREMTGWLVAQGIFRRQTSNQNNRHLPRRSWQPDYFVVKQEGNGRVTFPVAYATGEGFDLVVSRYLASTDIALPAS